MLTAFDQNWRTSSLPYSLSLANAVNTGGSFTTPSGSTQNSKIWASAGFRGFGPTMTFPGGAGMDGLGAMPSMTRRWGPVGYWRRKGMGSGCGCGGDCGCGHGLGQTQAFQNISDAISNLGPAEWIIIGLLGIGAVSVLSTGKKVGTAAHGAYKGIRSGRAKRRKSKAQYIASGGRTWGLPLALMLGLGVIAFFFIQSQQQQG